MRGCRSSTEVPDAVLWLLARPGEERLSAICGARWSDAVSMRGGSSSRCARPNPDYLALYRVADLFLDTWPYNAHTTASDALWAGCPVLTLPRRDVRVACRGEPVVGRRPARTDLRQREALRAQGGGLLARDADERRRLRGYLDGSGARQFAVRHRRDDTRAGSGVSRDGRPIPPAGARTDTDRYAPSWRDASPLTQ